MYKRAALLIVGMLVLNACSDKEPVQSADSEELIVSADNATSDVSKVIDIKNIAELREVFIEYNYTNDVWQKGATEIPRMTFAKVGKQWVNASKELPVKVKKSIFFRLMTPLILLSNEKILQERQTIIDAALDDPALKELALKYRVAKKTDDPITITPELKKQLLRRVDIIPPSLALAQAAEESGWASSRFTREGNAFFGQWDFSGKGMKPKEQRKELGNYGLARFDSPLASVEGYMRNINTSHAYGQLRQVRAQLRANNQPISGPPLAKTLIKYSERGQDYIDGLLHMMNLNKLVRVDNAKLMNNALVHLN